jgi:DNA repair exonuclease SbcCD nuclease subunit
MTRFVTLGDTHLGRRFVNNVPLHRRGEREAQVWVEFEKRLDPKGAEVHIHMGDIFDAAIVPYSVVWRAAEAYRTAAKCAPDTRFFVLRGNHDASRDLQAVSAFDIFEGLVRSSENIEVVTEWDVYDGLLFLGWSPTRSAAEIAAEATKFGIEFDIAFGHWDTDPRSDPFNLIPTKELAALGITEAYTGHVHLRDEFTRDGVNVHVVGSMLPYAHGEDADGATYVMLSLVEARDARPEFLKDKCVRVQLLPGEMFDLELDCLQLQVQRVGEVEEQIEVSLGDFDLNKLFETSMTEHAVPDDIKAEVRTEWTKSFALRP